MNFVQILGHRMKEKKHLKELIPEFDQYKQQNIEKHVDKITASIFNNLNDIKQLFEERN